MLCVARLYTCRATRTSPALTVTKDYSLWASWDAEGPFTLTTSELLGFNTGTFTTDAPGVCVESTSIKAFASA
jgi:hypothetical protein